MFPNVRLGDVERLVIGVLLLLVFTYVANLAINALGRPGEKDAATIGLLSGLAVGLLGPVGSMVQSVFRNDRVDSVRANATEAAVQSMAATANSNNPPTVRVEPGAEALAVTEATGTDGAPPPAPRAPPLPPGR